MEVIDINGIPPHALTAGSGPMPSSMLPAGSK